jgi:hypothetical protein
MLRFKINVHVKETVRAECPRHRKFDPSSDDKLNSETGCSTCADISLERSIPCLLKLPRSSRPASFIFSAANREPTASFYWADWPTPNGLRSAT